MHQPNQRGDLVFYYPMVDISKHRMNSIFDCGLYCPKLLPKSSRQLHPNVETWLSFQKEYKDQFMLDRYIEGKHELDWLAANYLFDLSIHSLNELKEKIPQESMVTVFRSRKEAITAVGRERQSQSVHLFVIRLPKKDYKYIRQTKEIFVGEVKALFVGRVPNKYISGCEIIKNGKPTFETNQFSEPAVKKDHVGFVSESPGSFHQIVIQTNQKETKNRKWSVEVHGINECQQTQAKNMVVAALSNLAKEQYIQQWNDTELTFQFSKGSMELLSLLEMIAFANKSKTSLLKNVKLFL